MLDKRDENPGDAYADYEGLVKYYVCEVLLAIKAEEESLKSMGLVNNQPL
ncbi:hypothetical protein JWG39_15505 [Desulforhopalus vacuolatus]|nr:hypothetical protein [Desulforhopalus vacuolatus]MBM9521226.1 hypothetical protein [Desulforhopalus vacuolatus]